MSLVANSFSLSLGQTSANISIFWAYCSRSSFGGVKRWHKCCKLCRNTVRRLFLSLGTHAQNWVVRHSKFWSRHTCYEMNWHPGASGSSATNLNGVQKGSHTKKCKLQCTASHTFPADLGMKCPSLQSTAKYCPQQAIMSRPRLNGTNGVPQALPTHQSLRLASAKCCRQP